MIGTDVHFINVFFYVLIVLSHCIQFIITFQSTIQQSDEVQVPSRDTLIDVWRGDIIPPGIISCGLVASQVGVST